VVNKINEELVVAMLEIDFEGEREEFIDIQSVVNEDIKDFDRYIEDLKIADILPKKELERLIFVLDAYELKMEENDHTASCSCSYHSFDKDFIHFRVEETLDEPMEGHEAETRNVKISRGILRREHSTNKMVGSVIDP